MANKPHKILKNPSSVFSNFTIERGNGSQPKKVKPTPESFTPMKKRLDASYIVFKQDVSIRHESRELNIPEHIDYVKIYFYKEFNADLQTKFRNSYGLSPILFIDLNHTVLFAITNGDNFKIFLSHIQMFTKSNQDVTPFGQKYSLILNINDFEFLTTSKILRSFSEYIVTVSLIDNAEVFSVTNVIFEQLLNHLNTKGKSFSLIKEANLLEIKNITSEEITFLANNFDIIHTIQSYHCGVGKPTEVGTLKKTYDFVIESNDDLVSVGVLDTGIQLNTPLRPVIIQSDYDLTNPTNPLPTFDTCGHGTAVAGLIVLGENFYKEDLTHYSANAKVLPIKILENENGIISIKEIVDVIRKVHIDKGIKLFNLSVNENFSKFYNSTVSEYAYLLDKLAFELDILIFISTGNLAHDDVQEIENNNIDFHKYPNHFFSPNKSSDQHVCESTNLNPPSDSYNNITVGAIAENFNEESLSHLTIDKSLPAFYSKKFYHDYTKKINNGSIKKSQKNINLSKPDIVQAGGDVLEESSKLQVISAMPLNPFYLFSCGSSLATPLTTSIAAQILRKYPVLNMQSVKALIINSAGVDYDHTFLKELYNTLRNDAAIEMFNISYDKLLVKDSKKINELFNPKHLLRYLIGAGVPSLYKCLESDSNSITFLIEDTIKRGTHKSISLKLPEYLNTLRENPKSGVLKITATICFKFNPVFNNHLSYCPLHISFGFWKRLKANDEENIKEISAKTTTAKQLEFKSGQKWSDDFYPLNTKPFSNKQSMTLYIRPCDLTGKLKNELMIVVRAITKTKGIDPTIQSKLESEAHPFSIAIRVEEIPFGGELSGNLYNQMLLDNMLQNISDIALEAEL